MKCTLYLAASIDGFIARDDDTTPWSEAEWQTYAHAVQERGNLIIGRRTYDIMKAAGEFEKIGHPLVVVLSETREVSPDGKIRFVKTTEEAMAVVKGQGFSEALVGGGTITASSFVTAGLLTAFIIDVEPMFLGSGKTMFTPAIQLPPTRLLRTTVYGEHGIQYHFVVR